MGAQGMVHRANLVNSFSLAYRPPEYKKRPAHSVVVAVWLRPGTGFEDSSLESKTTGHIRRAPFVGPEISRAEALAVFAGEDERFHHFSVDEVAVELQLLQCAGVSQYLMSLPYYRWSPF